MDNSTGTGIRTETCILRPNISLLIGSTNVLSEGSKSRATGIPARSTLSSQTVAIMQRHQAAIPGTSYAKSLFASQELLSVKRVGGLSVALHMQPRPFDTKAAKPCVRTTRIHKPTLVLSLMGVPA